MIPLALLALFVMSAFFNSFCKISCILISIVSSTSEPFLANFDIFSFNFVFPVAVLLYSTIALCPLNILLKYPSIPYLPTLSLLVNPINCAANSL